MDNLDKVKLLALEIVNLIDYGDKDFKTYGKIGDKIEELNTMRLLVIKYLIYKEKENERSK